MFRHVPVLLSELSVIEDHVLWYGLLFCFVYESISVDWGQTKLTSLILNQHNNVRTGEKKLVFKIDGRFSEI